MGEVRFMISEAAKQVHVESHVLRYWEEELELVIGRTEMGHRYYTEDDIQLFCCIKKLKDAGMLLKDLKPLIPELKSTKLKLQKTEALKKAALKKETTAPTVTEVVVSNNEELKKDISKSVTTDVIREMDFLFQAKERQEEEHFRKLDTLIRQQQANRKEAAREHPLGRLKNMFNHC